MRRKNSVPLNIYTVTLTLGDMVLSASHADATQAILELQPAKVNTRGVFRMEHNGKNSELMKNGTLTKLICANKLRAYAMAKNLIFLLK